MSVGLDAHACCKAGGWGVLPSQGEHGLRHIALTGFFGSALHPWHRDVAAAITELERASC
jgi:hypothetical protein